MTYEEEAIEQIDRLFAGQNFVGKDREVTITIRAKASEIVLEEYNQPLYTTIDPFEADRLHALWRYYRISLRNPTPPRGSYILEIKYPQQFFYYRLGIGQHSTYYKKTEGRDKMQFFMPAKEAWVESVYSAPEDYAVQGGHGRMHEVSFTDLPEDIQLFEGDCE
jgi:hypothetical protein